MLGKTKCVCGEKLENFTTYKPFKFDDKFYGGRVSMTADIICKCGRELKGYFESKPTGLQLIDLEITKEINKDTEETEDTQDTEDVLETKEKPITRQKKKK